MNDNVDDRNCLGKTVSDDCKGWDEQSRGQ